MNKQHSTLVLKTYNADVKNASITNYTFNNIDLRNLLSPELYNGYEKFNLVLKSIMTDGLPAQWGTNSVDRTLTIQMSGLDLINCYDAGSKALNSNKVDLVNFYFDNSIVMNYTDYNVCSFRLNKQNPNVNLSFQYLRVSDGATPQGNFGEVCFLFDIIGIDN